MKNLKVMYSHETDNWRTPTKLYNYYINELGCIDTFKYKDTENEFEKTYKDKRLFCNPPFSKLKEIPKWLKRQYENNCIIYLLIPARTDTKYFHEILDLIPSIVFIKGRLHYNDSKRVAPFPTILLVFNPKLQAPIYWTEK